MDSTPHEEIQKHFLRAQALDREARAAYLAELPSDLREEVESLLAYDETDGPIPWSNPDQAIPDELLKELEKAAEKPLPERIGPRQAPRRA